MEPFHGTMLAVMLSGSLRRKSSTLMCDMRIAATWLIGSIPNAWVRQFVLVIAAEEDGKWFVDGTLVLVLKSAY